MRSDEPTHDQVKDAVVEAYVQVDGSLREAGGVSYSSDIGVILALMRLERAILLQTLASMELRR
jgi:hypothetical protein